MFLWMTSLEQQCRQKTHFGWVFYEVVSTNNTIFKKTYNLDAKHKMHPYRVCLHAQCVQEGRRGENTPNMGVFSWMTSLEW